MNVAENTAIHTPHRLFDFLLERYALRNDAGLARLLNVAPPVISKVRNRRTELSDNLLLRIHEVTEVSIKELKLLRGHACIRGDRVSDGAVVEPVQAK